MGCSRSGLAYAAIAAVLVASGCRSRQQPVGSSPAPPQGKNNVVIDLSAPDLARLAVEVRSKEWAPLKYNISATKGRAAGGMFVPLGGVREIVVAAFDARGVETHSGSDQRTFGATVPTMSILMQPAKSGEPRVAQLANERVEIDRTEEPGGVIRVNARVVGPDGEPEKITPDDIRWGLSDPLAYQLFPRPDRTGFDVRPTPPPGETLTMCGPSATAFACRQGVCASVDLCRDPWVSIAAGGNHTCAVTQAGVAFCWGLNTDGQLGVPTTASCSGMACSPTPVAVKCAPGAPCRFKQIAVGAVRTCAIDTNDDAWCWGFGSTTHVRLQAQLAGATVKFKSITVGFSHVCAISVTRSELWCAGENFFGQLGLPRATFQQIGLTTPMRILVPLQFKTVVAGANHTCAVASSGTSMACWGDNRDNQLIDAASSGPFNAETGCTCTSSRVLQPLAGGVTVITAAAGHDSTCARRSTGETGCWGTGTGTLGFPSTQQVDRVTVGANHLCGLIGQSAFCAGNGAFGQLGNGAMSSQQTPVSVSAPPTAFADIAAGLSHTCGITPTGDAFCWGRNLEGQLGTGATSFAVVAPTRVAR